MRIRVWEVDKNNQAFLKEEFVPGEVRRISIEGEQFTVEFEKLGRTSSTQNVRRIEVEDD